VIDNSPEEGFTAVCAVYNRLARGQFNWQARTLFAEKSLGRIPKQWACRHFVATLGVEWDWQFAMDTGHVLFLCQKEALS